MLKQVWHATAILCLWGALSAGLPGAYQGPPAHATSPDLTDALLLFDGRQAQTADFGFRRVTDYYGLMRAEVDLRTTRLEDTLLRDEAGAYIPTVAVAGSTLESRLDEEEVRVLKDAVMAGGVNLLVMSLQAPDAANLQSLTDGAILGSESPVTGPREYAISSGFPDVARELSGLLVTSETQQPDYPVRVTPGAGSVDVIVTVAPDEDVSQPFFVRSRLGRGAVFAVGDDPDLFLQYNSLWESFNVGPDGQGFKQERFAQITPLMMFVRHTAGDEAWHSVHRYANLTVDDPNLVEDPNSVFSYLGLVPEMQAHNFHLTVAMKPRDFLDSQPAVIDLFLRYPQYLSLIQHGNNHDGYEFYKYETDPEDPRPARPLREQEADIIEGATRMREHERITMIPSAHAMIFPWNISPTPTLVLLKGYNFMAHIASVDVPLDQVRDQAFDSHMYPAELAYGNFASIRRYRSRRSPYPFELFLGRPIFMYEHRTFFDSGMDAFNPIADQVNQQFPDLAWRSLDYIFKRLYLVKQNDDGTMSVMFFTNHLLLTNETSAEQVYQLQKEEILNVPILRVAINGNPADYQVVDGHLSMEVTIPAGETREIQIEYGWADRDFAVASGDVKVDEDTGIITATVRNTGTRAGPVTTGFYQGDGRLIKLVTSPWIEPGSTDVITATITGPPPAILATYADPQDVIPEANEDNNLAIIAPYRNHLPLLLADGANCQLC